MFAARSRPPLRQPLAPLLHPSSKPKQSIPPAQDSPPHSPSHPGSAQPRIRLDPPRPPPLETTAARRRCSTLAASPPRSSACLGHRIDLRVRDIKQRRRNPVDRHLN